MRRRLAVVGVVAVAAAVLAVVLLARRGPDVPRTLTPGAGNTETTVDPIAWDADRKDELERRAAGGLAHVLYAKSPGGAVVSAARTATWRPQIDRVAKRAHLDPAMLEAIVMLESAGIPDAQASNDLNGAVGLTQILAETGRDLLGMRIDVRASERLTRGIERGHRVAARIRARRRVDQRVHPGEVATGFTAETLRDLPERLGPLRIDHSPLSTRHGPRGAIWVEPLLQAEIEYANVTKDGMLRHPSFKGLRLDKEAPIEVVAELPKDGREVVVDGHRIKLSNFSKVLWPKTGFTKGDLVAYYARVAPVLLPHLAGRMLTLKRYPNGVEGQHFYEKQCPSHRPDFVETAEVRWGKPIRFCVVENTATLVWLANLADIELHTSLALVPEVARPMMMVFDLDPGEPA